MMQLEIDTIARSGYLRAGKGHVSATNALSDVVYVDHDRNGNVLGIELIGRDAFDGTESLIATVVHVPTRLDYLIDEHRIHVEAGIGPSSSANETSIVHRHLAFARSIFGQHWNLDEIPDDALIILSEPGDAQRLDDLIELTDRERPAFLHTLGESIAREATGFAAPEEQYPHHLSLHLEGDVLKRLDRIADATGSSPTSVAIRMIEEGIQHEVERDPRLAS
jgi:uncharacterized protein YuzE